MTWSWDIQKMLAVAMGAYLEEPSGKIWAGVVYTIVHAPFNMLTPKPSEALAKETALVDNTPVIPVLQWW